jgi:hypothetical protein
VLPKKQEPTNREAFNSIIGRSALQPTPLRAQICKQLNADAPKPPTYPFIHSIFKERGHKTNNTPELRASCLRVSRISLRASQPAPRSVRLHRCVCSSSVRRYLGKPTDARKRVKHLLSHLGVGGIFTIKYPRLAQDSFCTAARVRRFVGLFSAILPSGRSEAPRRLPSIAPIPPCRPCRS